MVQRRNVRRVVALTVTVTAMVLGAVGAVPQADAAGVRYRDLVFDSYTTETEIYGRSINHLGVAEDHEVDILQPTDDPVGNRAAVVWVHGGFFKRGSKDIEWYRGAREQYVKAGYVVFSIDYRLNDTLPEGLLGVIETLRLEEYVQEAKDATHDAQAAVRWVRAHAKDYRIDPNLIAISGHSAGGIISQAVGYNEHDPGNSGTPDVSSRVNAVVSSAGGTLPGVLADVRFDEPPMLLSHGVVDDIVPYPADVPACVLTVLLGNVCEQQLDPDQEHGQFGYEGWRDFLYRRMIAPRWLQLPIGVKIVGYPPLFP